MMRPVVLATTLLSAIAFLCVCVRAEDGTTNVSCNFADGKQMSVRYSPSATKGKTDLAAAKLWANGKDPLLLFTQAETTAGNVEIPVGAYTLYLMGGKENWTLIVSKNVDAKAPYDPHQDLVRIPMPTGETNQPQKELSVAFAQVGAKQCNLRFYLGSTGAWAEFQEK